VQQPHRETGQEIVDGEGARGRDGAAGADQGMPTEVLTHTGNADRSIDTRACTRIQLLRKGLGDPRSGGWGFPAKKSGDQPPRGTGEPSEEAARVIAQLYLALRGAGPLLKKCCPGPPVQGLVFDYRNVPTRAVGELPCVTSLRDGRLVDLEGHEVLFVAAWDVAPSLHSHVLLRTVTGVLSVV